MTALALPTPRPFPRWLADSPPMGAATLLWAALLPPLALLALLPAEVGGERAWLKPLKFDLAFLVWSATLAYAARHLPAGLRASPRFRLFGWSVLAAMALEMAWIGGAAAALQKSHYNTTVPLLVWVSPAMGLLAAWLTGSALVWGVALLRAPRRTDWTRTLGLSMVATFALTLPVAFTLSGMEPPANGLPLLGWTFGMGDLRPAHFAATHAMQAVPLAALALGAHHGPALTALWAALAFALAALGLGLI